MSGQYQILLTPQKYPLIPFECEAKLAPGTGIDAELNDRERYIPME
jgi:hypothetical protein